MRDACARERSCRPGGGFGPAPARCVAGFPAGRKFHIRLRYRENGVHWGVRQVAEGAPQ
jgi:hypothetical protein